jgi:hypothetical protein
MKGGARTALAIGVGYALGRRRKMRMATMLAMAAATGGLGGLGPAALKRGVKLLSSTDLAGSLGPQVTEIVETVRGDLLDAGKAAATAAVSSRIDSLSENLHSRAETLKNPEAAASQAGERVSGTVSDVGERAGRGLRRLRRTGRGAEDAEDFEGEEEESANGRSRRAAPRHRRAARAEDTEEIEETEEPEEPEDYEDEEPVDDEADYADEADQEEEEPAPPRRRASRSPVTRTRR